jgi:hypothetical protein
VEALTAGDCATLYMDEHCSFACNVGVDLHVGGHVTCSEVLFALSLCLARSVARSLSLSCSVSLSLSLSLSLTHTHTHTHSKKKKAVANVYGVTEGADGIRRDRGGAPTERPHAAAIQQTHTDTRRERLEEAY